VERRTGLVAPTLATYGIATAVLVLLAPVGTWPVACVGAVACGAIVDLALWPRVPHRRVVAALQSLGVVGATMTTWALLAVEVPEVVGVAMLAGCVGSGLVRSELRMPSLVVAGCAVAVGVWLGVPAAGSWSVGEPTAQTPGMIASNGIDVSMDTHAFLLQQGVAILKGDGHTAEAGFFLSEDPSAPVRRTPLGAATGEHESYLWRMQTGARDADRKLKASSMPDHFFNWWTHSGKGLIAGPSAATWAEEQFTRAVNDWQRGDRASASYHLGAAAHLVDDACAPPHSAPVVPNHRAFENWVMSRQKAWTVNRGGIYQGDFRTSTGHGGDEWSSAHTRGWVDECAHRAAGFIVNAAQAPPDGNSLGSYGSTGRLLATTQRLTAGYLDFFLTTVGGPR
jgi:hypothetical protein